jgi:hypothetical protein
MAQQGDVSRVRDANRYDNVVARLQFARRAAISLCGLVGLAASAAPVPTATPPYFESGAVGPVILAHSGRAWHGPTGPTVDGLALSLTLSTYTLHFNNMVFATVELRNVSGEPKGSSFAAPGTTYTITVINRNTGERRRFEYRSKLGAPNGYRLAPETSVYLSISPELSWAWFPRIGNYALEAQITTANASMTLRSETVGATVLPEAGNTLDAGDESNSTPAGLPQVGLALSLAGDSSVHFGDPIYVELEMRNVSDEQASASLGLVADDDFSIVDRDTGEAVTRVPGPPSLRAATGLLAGGLTLLPRRSSYWRIRLDELYQITKPGTYSVQVTTKPIHVRNGDDSGEATLRSNMIAIHIASPNFSVEQQRKAGVYEDSSADTPAGPASHGFALSLGSSFSSALLGAPLTATVELRNVSGRPQYAFFGSRGRDYGFTIVSHATGQVARNLHTGSEGNRTSAQWNSSPIFPGASLYGSFRLDSFAIFSRIGTYTVRVEGRPIINGVPVEMQSNVLTITIR